jgi:hypothetical protein
MLYNSKFQTQLPKNLIFLTNKSYIYIYTVSMYIFKAFFIETNEISVTSPRILYDYVL